jgi:hypothetical protein
MAIEAMSKEPTKQVYQPVYLIYIVLFAIAAYVLAHIGMF